MKKKGIIIFSVFVAILAVLTIAYAVLKHNETPILFTAKPGFLLDLSAIVL